MREYRIAAGTWEIVRARASTMAMLKTQDQGAALVSWAKGVAEEWVALNIVQRLAELEKETRASTGEGIKPEDE